MRGDKRQLPGSIRAVAAISKELCQSILGESVSPLHNAESGERPGISDPVAE